MVAGAAMATEYATRLQTVEGDRLCNPQFRDGFRSSMRGGIEFDVYGAPIAYQRQVNGTPGRHLL
jgi:hypothetical protein